ncbi:MAG: VOC family protein [Cyclobacteriaceae bacterium]
MLTDINPKLPIRNKSTKRHYYINQLGFQEIGDYECYLMVQRDEIEIHFFEFKDLDPEENYGQVYIRTNDIDGLYKSMLGNKTEIHPKRNTVDQTLGIKGSCLA